MSCTCPELRYERAGRKIAVRPVRHDCAYVAMRNALIPEAEARADRIAGLDGQTRGRAAWNGAFFEAMEALVREGRVGTS